jgi:N-acetylglucosaminyldiphosphoundecaprenol N-acetyl-beta-D-mannosaminyltransferase
MKSQLYILGNVINSFNGYRDLYDYVIKKVKQTTTKGYVTVNNVHTMMEGYWDTSYQNIINNSFLSIPDGKPLQIVGKIKGHKTIARLFGPTVLEKFIDWGRADNVTHFFIGSSPSNLSKLKDAIQSKYPGAKIVGMISPPFKPMSEWDNEGFISAINEENPDFIWVGLGAPKQERWMFDQKDAINRGIMFGIGAGFDYLAGNTKHAPGWMKNASLEWLYRLIQEPKRLWKRYFKTIPPFLVLITLEICGLDMRSKNNNKNR